jgi:hypothetical protein
MNRNVSMVSWLIAVILILILTAGIASAATVTQSISFQGNLTNAAGTPLTGTFPVIFRLYNVASGGTALANDTHSVTAAKGQFTTTLNFAGSYYNGQALYVSFQRSPDPEKTRKALYPVPYALSLRPGTVISGSSSSPVVSASNSAGVAVYGKGKEGGYFTTNQAGTTLPGIPGVNVSTSYNLNPGIRIRTTGKYSNGVYAYTQGPYSKGVYVETSGLNSLGVYASTTYSGSTGVVASTQGSSSPGVYANTQGPNSPGVYVLTSGLNSPGVHAITMQRSSGSNAVVGETNGNAAAVAGIAHNTSSSPNYAYGLYGVTDRTDHKYGVYTPDYLYTKGTQVPAADVAEFMPVTEEVVPGTVLVIGDDGKLRPSSTPYDTRVAGIVSTDPGVTLGTKEDGNPGEAQIAVAGRVPCKVDATKAAIHAGDLLTTSDNPGYAMKAEPIEVSGRTFYPSGIVLGKAMGTLESGTGTIEVLVTLQ